MGLLSKIFCSVLCVLFGVLLVWFVCNCGVWFGVKLCENLIVFVGFMKFFDFLYYVVGCSVYFYGMVLDKEFVDFLVGVERCVFK